MLAVVPVSEENTHSSVLVAFDSKTIALASSQESCDKTSFKMLWLPWPFGICRNSDTGMHENSRETTEKKHKQSNGKKKTFQLKPVLVYDFKDGTQQLSRERKKKTNKRK